MNLFRTIALTAMAAGLAAGADRHMTYDEMAAAADKVVLGTTGVRSSHWGDDSHIYTQILISPDVTIKGAEEGAVLVEVLGGTVGDTTMSVSDGPEFPEGQRVVVFLKREQGRFVVVGRSAGAVRANAAEAAEAVESAFGAVERATGQRRMYHRGLAGSYLSRATTKANAQVGCYNTDGGKWSTTSATYKIGSTIPADWAASIDASAATWSNAGANFRLVNDSASINELSFKDLVATYGSSYSNTFAVTTTWASTSTGRISKATIEVNTKYQWSTSGATNQADVQNILTHEFGHWMRLLDIYSPSTCSDVTMWGSAGFGETKKRTLEQADLDGFRNLYGGGATVGAPTLFSPANGASDVLTAPTLMWSTGANATSYDVYFGTATTPPLVGTVAGTTFQTSGLTAGAVYYWRVVAKGGSGSESSPTWSFRVTSGSSGGLTLLSPADGATGVSTRPGLQWSAVAGAAVYDIYLSTSSSPGLIGTVNGTSATVTGLRRGTLYYWKVIARTAAGPVSSAVASFRTN